MIIKHSAGGIVIKEGEVLTISWTTKDYIAFPKGGVEDGETSELAAVREVLEETGYKTRIIAPLNSWTYEFEENGEDYRKTVDYYLMEILDDKLPIPNRLSTERFENLWLTIEDAQSKLTFNDSREALVLAVNRIKNK